MTRQQLTKPPAPLDHLPHLDPGTPVLSSVRAFMFWLARGQWRLLASGVVFGIIWMVGQAAIPFALGRGVQAITEKNTTDVAYWAIAVVVFGTVQGFAGVMRHRRAVANWMTAAVRLQQLLARKASYLGGDLSRQVATGEVVAVNANDVEKVARAFDVIPRFIGAIVAFFVIAWVLMYSSVTLGVIVLFGVPLLASTFSPSVAVFALCFLGVGFASAAFWAVAQMLLQHGTDPEFQGRVMSLYTVAWGGTTIFGALAMGALIDAVSARAAMAVGGVVTLVVAAVLLRWARRQTTIGRLPSPRTLLE